MHDKLEKMSTRPNSRTSISSPTVSTFNTRTRRAKPEEIYEILCNDEVLSLDMTLAAVRQYFWRQSSELVMHYRLRRREAILHDDADVAIDQCS